MPRTDEIVSRLRDLLRVSDPDLDTTAGSTTRKIIDAVGEVVAEAYVDQHLLEYTYDVDAKTGADLDALVGLFGFTRFAERRATGTVTFERQEPAPSDIYIPTGTLVSTQTSPPVSFATVVPAVMRLGETNVTIPIRAVEGGSRGNVGAGAISRRLSPLSGISGVTNLIPTTGGQDAENDASLRRRFKATVFRSLAGTEQMYAGVAQDDPDTVGVNVIGVVKQFEEQIEIDTATGVVTVPDSRFVQDGSVVVRSTVDDSILVEGIHYTVTIAPSGNDHTVTLDEVSAGSLPDGIYNLFVAYVPNASRNDPDAGITNRVDVYINGERPEQATDSVVFQESVVFVNDANDPLHYQNFQRRDGSTPAVGARFVRLTQSPILLNANVGMEITIPNGTDPLFEEGTHFWLVNDITNEGMAPRRLAGIEFVEAELPVTASALSDTVFSVDYIFNAVPRSVQENIEQWRLLTTDVLVHQAKPIPLAMYFVIVLSPGGSLNPIEAEVYDAAAKVVNSVGFNNRLQTSDVLEAVAGIEGVDAVRFATLSDADDPSNDLTGHAIQRLALDGTPTASFYATGGRAIDVVTDDDEVARLDTVEIDLRARSTFHTGH